MSGTTFESFDWENDVDWKNYLDNALIPNNSNYYTALLKLKQKYYKRKIDPNYEIKDYSSTSTTSQSSTSSQNTNTNTNNNNSNNSNNNSYNRTTSSTSSVPPSAQRTEARQNSTYNRFLYIAWTISQVSTLVFTIVYLFTSYSNFYRAILASFIGYSISLFPVIESLLPMSQQKLMEIAKNDNLHYSFYCLIFYFLGYPSFVILLPNFIYALYQVLGKTLAQIRNRIPPTIYNQLALLESKRSIAVEQAVKFEIYNVIVLILGIFTYGLQRSIILLVLYYQFLKLRYTYSDKHRLWLTQVGLLVDQYIINNNILPIQIRNIIRKIKNYL
ncbi:transmembrane protein [Tieghemostelium lacteum]|uniref:Transmembrane protein n=1 Tax=Tieghemostelium lacteum TaxID=361077 RepID=A0A151Z4T7_TIELA|nr:transmembrane protein [Tieghemostelium lacteum]|eukprot:KYQ88955.1 transmembrane protein [Tieghemostelium lacteum]